MTERAVNSADELLAFFDTCMDNRSTSSTKLNDRWDNSTETAEHRGQQTGLRTHRRCNRSYARGLTERGAVHLVQLVVPSMLVPAGERRIPPTAAHHAPRASCHSPCRSSRSHAIFTITVQRTIVEVLNELGSDLKAKVGRGPGRGMGCGVGGAAWRGRECQNERVHAQQAGQVNFQWTHCS